MNVALRVPMTLEQFLDWEERQAERFEFDGRGPVAMTGVRVAHAIVQRNLITALTTRLDGRPCQAFGSDLKVQVAGRIRYPDAFVTCTPIDPRALVVTEPVVVFEILSSSTAENDLVFKNAEYRDTPSVQRYVVLQQASAAAMVFSHQAGVWALDLVAGIDKVLTLPEIGVEVPLSVIYKGVPLAMTDEAPR